MPRPPARRLAALAVLALGALMFTSCGPGYTLVSDRTPEIIRNETFDYRKWLAEDTEPETVVIALHGFSGASIDYENLAKHLLEHQPRTAVYAYELRGQGNDPKKSRRGDIEDPANWSRDLLTFTKLIEREHPDARIVWFGESMGGLILSHTFRDQIRAGLNPPCDAIGLASPVVRVRDDFPAWKEGLVRTASLLAPKARVSLETLSGGEEVRMTENSVHSDQSETNSWHVEKHTLRLLVSLGDMIEAMPACAETFSVPTLVLHGGHDFFSTPEDVATFTGRIPESTSVTHEFYPDGHHLLMYDHVKDEVVTDITDWLEDTR